MGNYNFRKDLKMAKKTEVEVAQILTSLYKAKLINYEDTNKYDILMKVFGMPMKFEVKEDFMCGITGNAVVEYESRGKPSGISVCEAYFYIHKMHLSDGVKFLMHRTTSLKKLIADKKYYRIVNGGDRGSNTMNYLFKYDVFAGCGRILPLDRIK